MLKSSKKGIVICLLALLLMAVIGIVSISLTKVANAADDEDFSNYNFTAVTNEEGEQSYSVAIRMSLKPTVESVKIPDTYNGLPVTEISNNGFMSCAKLRMVILPESIVKIGNNAFINCAKLESVFYYKINSIGNGAFAMCPLLNRQYIPETVNFVGANAFRNNSNTIFVQSSEEETNSLWQSNWKSYFTGNVIYGIEPEDTVGYREITNECGEAIGYEVAETQRIIAPDKDIIIYNSFRASEEAEYLPVLNVCPEVFAFCSANSIIFRDRHSDDINAPVFSHKINIRSNAFAASCVNKISFEVGLTFDHPTDLQNTQDSVYDFLEISGDSDGHSIKVFAGSSIDSVTLPSDIDFVPKKMFYGCTYLKTIEYNGQTYEKNFIASSITRIGDEAFHSCVYLDSLTIPSSVTEMGSSVFSDWGTNPELAQILNIPDYYEGYLPDGWAVNWFGGNSAIIKYKEKTEVKIDLQDDSGETISIFVVPGREMPELEKIEKKGYKYNGIFSEKAGGKQYYSETNSIVNNWNDDDPLTIYAQWTIITYDIIFPDVVAGANNPNKKEYTVNDELFIIYPIDYNGYSYSFKPNIIDTGKAENIVLQYEAVAIKYNIEYDFENKEGFDSKLNPNPKTYTVDDEVVFKPIEYKGWELVWESEKLEKGTTGDRIIEGTWQIKVYKISYVLGRFEINHPDNPTTYTYFEPVKLHDASMNYMHINAAFKYWTLNNEKITEISNMTGDIKLVAVFGSLTKTDMPNGDHEYYLEQTGIKFKLPENPNGTITLHIYKNVKLLYLEGAYNDTPITHYYNYNIEIEIYERDSEFSLILQNIQITAPNWKYAITVKGDAVLNLWAYETVKIYGGLFSGVNLNALDCKNLIVCSKTNLYIHESFPLPQSQANYAVYSYDGKYEYEKEDQTSSY